MEITEFKHIKAIEIRYDDLDTFNHVNNKAYLSYLEEARIDLYNQLYNIRGNLKITAIVARIEIDYIKPIIYGQKLSLHTKISKIGNKSFELASIFMIMQGAEIEYEIAAKAKVTLVNFDPKTGNSAPIPENERKIMNDFQAGQNI